MYEKYRDYFDRSIKDLPVNLKDDVLDDFAPIGWEQLSPEKRRSFAVQQDQVKTDVFGKLYDLEVRRGELQEDLEKVEQMVPTTPTATRDKRAEIADLSCELSEIEQQMDCYSKDRTHQEVDENPKLTLEQYVESLREDGENDYVIAALSHREYPEATNAKIGRALGLAEGIKFETMQNKVRSYRKKGEDELSMRGK